MKEELQKIYDELDKISRDGAKADSLMPASQYYPLLAAAVKLKKLVDKIPDVC